MLGIDVAKDTLACTLLDPHTRKTLWRKSLPNTPGGINTLLSATPADAPWVLEPTGRYSTPVAQLARQAHRSVLLAPPRQAKSFLRSIQCRAKTDQLDSEGLALFALSQTLAPYPLKTPMQEQVDQLLLARKGLARAAASLGQQVKELPHAKEPLQKALAEIKAQIKVLDEQIAALTEPARTGRRRPSSQGAGHRAGHGGGAGVSSFRQAVLAPGQAGGLHWPGHRRRSSRAARRASAA